MPWGQIDEETINVMLHHGWNDSYVGNWKMLKNWVLVQHALVIKDVQ